MSKASLTEIAGVFLRAGNFTFGGGDPTMAVLQREMVNRRKWLSAEQYGLVYGLARVTPGTNVLAFYAGSAWLLRGVKAAALAVLSTCLPSAVVVVWLTYSLERWGSLAWVKAAGGAIMAAAVGMIAASAWLLIAPFFGKAGLAKTVVLAGGAAALAIAGVTPIPVLALAALAGFLWKGTAQA